MADIELQDKFDNKNEGEDVAHAQPYEFDLEVDPEQDDRATELKIYSFKRPHMRGFHASWIAFFSAFFAWFAIAPIMPTIKAALNLRKGQVWATNITSVASTIAMRFVVGPLCDIYGPKTVMAILLVLGSIPTYLIGTVTSYTGLAIVRFFIGTIGASFVMCQYWTSIMFAKNIVGSANAIVGGWGNLGGGVTNLVMGSAIFPLFEQFIFSGNTNAAWRTVFVVPATFTAVVGVCIYYLSDDCPHGDYAVLKKERGPDFVAKSNFLVAAMNLNTVILFIQYGCCFGVELTMNNAAALYFFEEFDQSQAKAAAIASSFGFMNLFCRGLGGFFSDYMNKKMHMRGRLLAHILCLIGEGIMIFVFAEQSQLGLAAFALIVFSAFVQSSEGTSYAIVPYIDPENLGAVSGIVGAGGNMGAVCWGLIFLYGDGVKSSLRKLAIIVCCSTILTFFIRIPGHYMLIGGEHNPALQRSNSRKSFKSSNSFDTLPTDNQPRELAQA